MRRSLWKKKTNDSISVQIDEIFYSKLNVTFTENGTEKTFSIDTRYKIHTEARNGRLFFCRIEMIKNDLKLIIFLNCDFILDD